jgi:hypothetical protein
LLSGIIQELENIMKKKKEPPEGGSKFNREVSKGWDEDPMT